MDTTRGPFGSCDSPFKIGRPVAAEASMRRNICVWVLLNKSIFSEYALYSPL